MVLCMIWCIVFITLVWGSFFQHPYTMLAIKSELRRLSHEYVSTNSHGSNNGDGNENDITFSAWETSTDYFEFHVAHDLIHDNHDASFVCLDQGGESIEKFEDEALVCSMIL